MKSKLKKLFDSQYYTFNMISYQEAIAADYRFNASFRNCKILSNSFLDSYEWKYVKLYRACQVNVGRIWEKLYKKRLHKLSKITGIDLEINLSIGKGLIIGHWGRIVINEKAKFGNEMMITHGVTIGRDVRGKRKGAPTFGNRVCIRANSTVVGNIRIGNDVLIAPNTFVNFDVPDHSVVIGNPATIHHRDNATEGHLGEL